MSPLPPVPARIEDYALLSDCSTAALVSRSGSIDWLCWPRFDSDACLAALLGGHENGRWQICPADTPTAISRTYRDGSTILETVFETASGTVALIDFMPLGATNSSIIRILEGRAGTVAMQMRLKLRFDYGISVPWVTRLDNEPTEGLIAIAGPNLVVMRCDIPTEGRDLETVADFTIAAGQSLNFTMRHGPSHLAAPPPLDVRAELARTEADWHTWSDRCTYDGPHAVLVKRSLVTLKALTYEPTGGIVAAPTTSLPEAIGGARNWDYRYCWLRDATFTLFAFMLSGYYDEAQAWGLWLHRSIAGSADQLQIMYGLAGERRLDEREATWLSGYENSRPVRIGNAAAGQVQLDVFGEVMGSMRQLRRAGMDLPAAAWSLQCNLLDHLSSIWRDPDEGIWEVRGQRRHFTFSKMMAWSAYNQAIEDAEDHKLDAPLDDWRAQRDELHALICARGFSRTRNSFTQSFDADTLDASLLLIPLIDFLPPDDPRVAGTVAAIESNLLRNGLVQRYESDEQLDGQSGSEGAFLACSFWLVTALVLQNRPDDARALFDRLAALANDVGLLAEEYDTTTNRQVGNFPQAFSHLALVNSAFILRDGRRNTPDQPAAR